MKFRLPSSLRVRHDQPGRRSRWFRRSVASLALVGLPLVASSAQAANYYWDPAQTNTDPGSGGTGNWNTTSTFWKLQGTSGDVVWPNTSANTADFAGTAGTVTLGSAITTGGLIFDTAGYSLATSTFALSLGTSGITANPTSGTTAITGAITALGSQTWTTATGGTLSMGATYTSAVATAYSLMLTGAGTVNISGGSSGAPNVVTGVFNPASGSTVNVTGFLNTTSSNLANTKFTVNGGSTVNWSGTGTQSGIYNGISDGTSGTLNVTAGSFTSSPTTATFVGNGGTGLLNISGGLVTIGTNTPVYVGDGYNGTSGNAGGSGTITISGGQFTTGTTTGSFVLGSTALTGTGTINLNGGTFSSSRAFTGATGRATINFNGGTLQATATALTIPNTIATTISTGGATIDSQTFALSIATNFTHNATGAATDGGLTLTSSAATGKGTITLGGILSQTGGLTISTGAALSGNNTYTGPTAISGFVDASASGNVLGATGAGNGTTINTGGTFRFRDTGNITIPEAITLNGGNLIAYNDPNTTTFSGAITLNTNSSVQVQPQSQGSTTTAFSGGFIEGGSASNLSIVRSGAAAAASSDIISITGASTYGGATAITDTLATANTGVFAVQLSGGDNRLPVTTSVSLGNVVTTTQVGTRLILGNATAASNQTLTGLTVGSTSTNNAVFGGNATTASILTLNIANGVTDAYTGKLGGSTATQNNLALTKSGSGTLTLSAANTYTGATTVNRGTLALSYATTSANVLPAASALVLGGGTLTLGGNTAAATQTVAGLTVNPGSSTVVATSNNAGGLTLALGAVARTLPGGTVDFNNVNTTGTAAITTTTANVNASTNGTGILGAYATYNKSDWATNNGGTITAFTNYATYNNVAGWSGNVDGKDVTDDGNGYDGSATNSITINSLRFNEGNADPTVNVNGNNNLTISSGGILVTPNLGSKYARINGGGLTTGAADLVIQQNNTGSGHLQIGSSIFGSGGLTKSGVGALDLSGSDAPYTGVTTLNGGTTTLIAAITGTTAVAVNSSGTLLLGANDRVNDAATVTLNGGTVNTGGFQEGRATGTAAATQGLGALTLSSSSILDFGAGHAGSSVLAFAASNGQAWSGILTLLDFTPGTDFLNFSTSTGLTAGQLGEISLSGYNVAGLDSFGDVLFVPVPEPATWAAGILMIGAVGYSQRRRLHGLFAGAFRAA